MVPPTILYFALFLAAFQKTFHLSVHAHSSVPHCHFDIFLEFPVSFSPVGVFTPWEKGSFELSYTLYTPSPPDLLLLKICFFFSVFYSKQSLLKGLFLFHLMSIYKISKVIFLFCLNVFKSIGVCVVIFFLFSVNVILWQRGISEKK